MGYLNDVGLFFDYYESLAFQKLVKEKGIVQFLYLLKNYQSYKVDNYLYPHIGEQDEESKSNLLFPNMKDMKIYWGDEFEGHIIRICKQYHRICLQPNTGQLFKKLEENKQHLSFTPLPEYGSWMLENTPNKPYYHLNCNVDLVIANIRARIREIRQVLPEQTDYLLLPVFPRLGCFQFSVTTDSDLTSSYMEKTKSQSSYLEKTPTETPFSGKTKNLNDEEESKFSCGQLGNNNDILPPQQKDIQNDFRMFSNSQFIDDRIINPHPRYSCLTLNLRLRRGSKMDIRVPIFKDEKTSYEVTECEPYPGYIYMDHMAFGMGNCALQMTFLSKDIEHARLLYDQFAPLSPLFMALTAGSPVFKGKLADWDTKWEVLSMSVDDRTEKERDPNDPLYIPKSRYSSISHYISNNKMNRDEYNDIKFRKNEEIMKFTRTKAAEMGIQLDERLIEHLGVLFIRDAMVLFKDKVFVDDSQSSNHFENIQSTNWNSVRFKPPPSQNSTIGWRVEFRTAEIQLTADENAAISIFFLKIVCLFYFTCITVNFYMPLSLVDENFKRARSSNAILTEKFWWRKNILDEGPAQMVEMTLDEIFFGNPTLNYQGIYSIINQTDQEYNSMYLTPKTNLCSKIYQNVQDYIEAKTKGKVRTLAQWMRNFIIKHQNYQKDSIVSHEIEYDMITHLLKIVDGQVQDPDFPQIFPQI